MIREFVLQLKLGSVRPAYFREKYGVNVLERFRDQLRLAGGRGLSRRPRRDDVVALTREGLLRVDVAAPAVLPARARRHPLHLMPMAHPRWSEYRLRRRVQFHETDSAGIVHFSWFFRYMEEAEHAMWREAGLSIAPPGVPISAFRASSASCRVSPAACVSKTSSTVGIRIAAISEKTIRYDCRADAARTRASRPGR